MFFQARSPSDTLHLGKQIGRLLRRGDVVALVGELGAGKTQLIKGLALGAGVRASEGVSSPSFTLIKEYKGPVPFYHIDLYRVEHEGEAEELGLREYFFGDGIAAVEWADRIPRSLLPERLLMIHILYTGKQTRTIEITGLGKHYEALIKEIESHVPGFTSQG